MSLLVARAALLHAWRGGGSLEALRLFSVDHSSSETKSERLTEAEAPTLLDTTASNTNKSAPGAQSTKPQEWYSTTPLIMDAAGKDPLKSSEYASSHDDVFGVQRNWFTSLYKQLNYLAKTGTVPSLKGRQKQVICIST
jgi:hypothetical protein